MKPKYLTMVLLILLAATVLPIVLNQNTATASESNYGDVMQYDWPISQGGDSGLTCFSSGPGPNTANVLWARSIAPAGLSSPPIAVNGKIICANSTFVMALDAFSGNVVWTTPIPGAFNTKNNTIVGNGAMVPRTMFAVNKDYIGFQYGSGGFGVTGAGVFTLRASDGVLVSQYAEDIVRDGFLSTVFSYVGGAYSSWDKLDYASAYSNPTYYKGDSTGKTSSTPAYLAVAFNFSDPTNIKLAWTWIAPIPIETVGTAPGLALFGGTVGGEIFALNATNGQLVWSTPKQGNAGYVVNYYEGKIYHAASSTCITCWNATNGDIIFNTDEGARAFFAYGGALAYNRYFDKNIALPRGYVAAWSAETGEKLWSTSALYMIAYLSPVVADGKVYVQQYSGSAGGVPAKTNTFSCFDAFTGKILWQLPNFGCNFPIIAYGNLYGYSLSGGLVVCIGDKSAAWNQWCGGSSDAPGIANNGNPNIPGMVNGAFAPLDINTPKWIFNTGRGIEGSAVADNGYIYFGSEDANLYCLDAQTGSLIWKFPTGYRIRSTPAVSSGVVYTGADDGNVYAINALTGQQIWKLNAGGYTQAIWMSAWQTRSSPIVVGDRIYVGSLDGNLYCISKSGTVQWKSPVGSSPQEALANPPGGTPLVSGSSVYITGSNGTLYAFNANNGARLWERKLVPPTITIIYGVLNFVSTPVAVKDIIWICASTNRLYGLNQTTGEILVAYPLPYSVGGIMTPASTTPAYFNLNSSTQMLLVGDGFMCLALNITRIELNRTQVNGYPLYYTNSTNTYYIDPYYAFNRTVILADGRVFQNLTQIATAIINSQPSTAYPESIYDHMPGQNNALKVPAYATPVNATTNHNVYWNQLHANGTYYPDTVAYSSSNRTMPKNTPYTYLPIGNETYLQTIWEQWMGHQIYSSPIIANSLGGQAVYFGDDVYSITCLNLTTGLPISQYSTKAQVFSTACIYEGNVYFGSYDGNMYCFSQTPAATISLTYTSNKVGTMWNNETLTIAGRVQPEVAYGPDPETDTGNFGNFASNGLYNATVYLSVTKPDFTSENLTTTTDAFGNFAFSLKPTAIGTWGWVVYYPSQAKAWITYNEAYSEWTEISVTAAPSQGGTSPTPTPTPTPAGGMPVEYIYAAVAVIAIVLIAIGAYAYIRRSKK